MLFNNREQPDSRRTPLQTGLGYNESRYYPVADGADFIFSLEYILSREW